jgi:hypothetical protein
LGLDTPERQVKLAFRLRRLVVLLDHGYRSLGSVA